MKIKAHTTREYADATKALLPEGKAWDWPVGGFGDALLLAISEAPARLAADIQVVVDSAPEQHKPQHVSWTLDDYQRVADEAVAHIQEKLPRSPFICGESVCGDRLWEDIEPNEQVPVPLVRVSHLVGPFICGESCAGDRLWSTGYVLLVQYYASVADPKAIWDALMDFKQAHMTIYMEDITGWGGEISF